MGVWKTTARAYAEDAPAVKKAGDLVAKVDKVEQKLEAVDAKCARLRDLDERAARDRSRVDRLERWRDGDAGDALDALAKGELGGGDKASLAKVAKVEEGLAALRGALAEVAPRAGKGPVQQHFKPLSLGHIDVVSADFWTDRLSLGAFFLRQ